MKRRDGTDVFADITAVEAELIGGDNLSCPWRGENVSIGAGEDAVAGDIDRSGERYGVGGHHIGVAAYGDGSRRVVEGTGGHLQFKISSGTKTRHVLGDSGDTG